VRAGGREGGGTRKGGAQKAPEMQGGRAQEAHSGGCGACDRAQGASYSPSPPREACASCLHGTPGRTMAGSRLPVTYHSGDPLYASPPGPGRPRDTVGVPPPGGGTPLEDQEGGLLRVYPGQPRAERTPPRLELPDWGRGRGRGMLGWPWVHQRRLEAMRGASLQGAPG